MANVAVKADLVGARKSISRNFEQSIAVEKTDIICLIALKAKIGSIQELSKIPPETNRNQKIIIHDGKYLKFPGRNILVYFLMTRNYGEIAVSELLEKLNSLDLIGLIDAKGKPLEAWKSVYFSLLNEGIPKSLLYKCKI
jgi:hypothetical protein